MLARREIHPRADHRDQRRPVHGVGLRLALLIALLAPGLLGAPGDLREILANRVDVGRKAVGIVAGTIDAERRQTVGYGKVAKGRGDVPDGDTIFEIGSITKVFTSLILADMVENGEVKLDDPISKYLPDNVTVPSRNGRRITLLDISTQTSGLPRLPANVRPSDPGNPYADYDPPKLYEFLSGYTLTRDPGERYEYSNLAVGLLGHALARKAGMSYERLVRTRILEPLGMTSTAIALTPEQAKRFAPGYGPMLNPVKNWDFDALAGAGAFRSSANDLLKFFGRQYGADRYAAEARDAPHALDPP